MGSKIRKLSRSRREKLGPQTVSLAAVISFSIDKLYSLLPEASVFCHTTGKLVDLAGVAQLVAQAICNRQVVGSSPTTGSSSNPWPRPRPRFFDAKFAGQDLARATSNIANAAALDTLSEAIWPNCGIEATTSQRSLANLEIPRPSAPKTRATGWSNRVTS